MIQRELFVSVVAPLSNDADIVDAFIAEVAQTLGARYEHREIILVDDCSDDDTRLRTDRLVRQFPECRVLRLSRRFGTEVAISAGLESAIGDYVVVMSPDMDPAEPIEAMVNLCRDGAGVVMGIREHRQGEPWYLRLGAWGFYQVLNRILGLRIPPDVTHFRVMSRQVVNAVMRVPDRNRYLRTLTLQVGYPTALVRYAPVARRPERKSKSLREAIQLAGAIAITNSSRPLYLVSVLGLMVSVVSMAFTAFLFGGWVFGNGTQSPWTGLATITAASVSALALMGAVGLLYLARLLEERSGRPLYFVMEERTAASVGLTEDTRNVVSESVAPR